MGQNHASGTGSDAQVANEYSIVTWQNQVIGENTTLESLYNEEPKLIELSLVKWGSALPYQFIPKL